MDEIFVKDVMLSLAEYATIGRGCTIEEALTELSKSKLGLTNNRHHHRAILVLDDDGNVIGKLSHWAVLKSLDSGALRNPDLDNLSHKGIPHFLIKMLKDDLFFFRGSLKSLCRAAARVKVEDAMVPVVESIEENALLNDAIRQMVLGHIQSLLVTSSGQAVGIIRLSDVFETIADEIRFGGTTDAGIQ